MKMPSAGPEAATAFLCVIATLALATATSSWADEEAWMVKSAGVIGCEARETMTALKTSPESSQSLAIPDGCVPLELGERLLHKAAIGGGFDPYMKLTRRDGSVLLVPSSEVVRDPGLGSISEDRAGE
jgi:hypothetical protein